MLENMNGESAFICMDGSTDNIVISTAADNSNICNFQDEDSSNTRVSYINSSGNLIVVSSK